MTPEQLRRIQAHRDALPAPFAPMLGELLHELRATTPDHARVFMLQIDLFEAGVAFLGFGVLAQLQSLSDLTPSASRPILEQLRDNPKMATGHWWTLLRETGRDLPRTSPGAPPVHPLARIGVELFHQSSKKGSSITGVLDAVPGLRNRLKGHTWTLPRDHYAELAASLLDHTLPFLDAVRGLSDVAVFHLLACETGRDGSHRWDLLLLHGDTRRPPRFSVTARDALRAHRVYAAPRDELLAGTVAPNQILDLHPFVQWRTASAGDALHLLQGIDAHTAHLQSVLGAASVECADTRHDASARLGEILDRGSRTHSVLGRLRPMVRDAARATLSSVQARASYETALYLARTGVVAQHESWERGNATLAVVSGPSGSGKTALCCYLLDRWLVAGPEDQLVALAFASELPAHGGSLAAWWRSAFGLALADVLSQARSSGTRVTLLVDGADRIEHPARILEDLVDELSDPDSALRVLVTGLEPAASAILRAADEVGLEGRVARWGIPSLTEDEARRIFTLVSREQGAEELPSALIPVLRTPLFVRLARNALRRRGTGVVTPGLLLLTHLERTVFEDPSRSELALSLAAQMLDRRTKSLDLGAATNAAALRGLIADHVLVLERAPDVHPSLPLPGIHRVAFAFDALLEYLALVALLRRAGGDLGRLGALVHDAEPFGPLVGALRLGVVEALLDPRTHAREDPGALLEALSPSLREAVLTEVFSLGLSSQAVEEMSALTARIATWNDGPAVLASAMRAAAPRLLRSGYRSAAIDLQLGVAAVLPKALRVPLRVAAARWVASGRDAAVACEILDDALRESDDDATRASAQYDLWKTAASRGDGARVAEARAEILALGDEAMARSPLVSAIVHLSRMTPADPPAVSRERADRALASAREAGDRSWIHRALRARADVYRTRAPDPDERARAAAAEAEFVEAAENSGDPALEADALEFLAGAHSYDPSATEPLIARGLGLAVAAGDLALEANLLAWRAGNRLHTGAYEEGVVDSEAALATFERLGFHGDRDRIGARQTTSLAWERGLPGTALRLLEASWTRHAATPTSAIGSLAGLMLASLRVDLGDADGADALIGEVRAREAIAPSRPPLRFEPNDGRVAQRRAAYGDARGHLRKIYEDESASGRPYADFVFQPLILLARLEVEVTEGGATSKDLDWTLGKLREHFDDARFAASQRARFLGEMEVVLARAALVRGNLQEARVWISSAETRLSRYTHHRLLPELAAVLGLLARRDATQRGTSAPREARALEERAKGILGTRVPRLLAAQAASFARAEDAEAFTQHHPATRLMAWGAAVPG